LPFAVWVLTTFFQELPYDIEERRWSTAAHAGRRFDSSFCRWRRRDFLPRDSGFYPCLERVLFRTDYLTYPALQTLPVGIALFPGEYTMPWGEIAAASTIATLPLVALTLIFNGASSGLVSGSGERLRIAPGDGAGGSHRFSNGQ